MAKPTRHSHPADVKAETRTFFVTSRTAEGKALLQTDRMAGLFVDVLRSYMRTDTFKGHDFVIIRNHVHLILTLGHGMTIEKAMQLIKGNFAFRARKELGIREWIWQRGFSDVQIRDEVSFRIHQGYIYNNPVKAGMARVPEDYPHGSLYLRRLKENQRTAQQREEEGHSNSAAVAD